MLLYDEMSILPFSFLFKIRIKNLGVLRPTARQPINKNRREKNLQMKG